MIHRVVRRTGTMLLIVIAALFLAELPQCYAKSLGDEYDSPQTLKQHTAKEHYRQRFPTDPPRCTDDPKQPSHGHFFLFHDSKQCICGKWGRFGDTNMTLGTYPDQGISATVLAQPATVSPAGCSVTYPRALIPICAIGIMVFLMIKKRKHSQFWTMGIYCAILFALLGSLWE